MGSVHQLPEQGNVILFQSPGRTDGSLIFIYGMVCPLLPYRILDGIFMLLKLLLSQLAESLDIRDSLKFLKCSLTFISPVIVGRVNQAVLYLAVRDYDSGIWKLYWGILIMRSFVSRKIA